MPRARKRLYLIDGYSNIFRAFYAIRELSTSKGEPTNAVYGFLQMLRKLLREEKPELVGVALDVSEKTVRTDRYADYKSNRAPMPEDLRPQIPWIRHALEAYRIPVVELEKYEADDVLGTLAKKAAAQGYEVVLVSADKDLMQLVNSKVFLYHTGRNKLYDPEAVTEDFGLPPAQVTDVLALMGDSIDNVPGVKGIGEKGAKSLIREYGSLEKLLDRADEISRRSYREGLQRGRDDALLSKELVTIHTDLPVEFHEEELHREPPDQEALRRLFAQLEFYSLLDELDAEADGCEVGVEVEEVTERGSWQRWVGVAGKEICLAVLGGEPPLGAAFGRPEGAVIVADFRRPGMRQAVAETLDEWLPDPTRELVGHDLKEVLRLSARGSEATVRLFDLMLASYLIRSSAHGHSLDELALERLGRKAMGTKDAGWAKGEEPLPGAESLLRFAAERIDLCRRLVPGLRQELAQGPLQRVYDEIEAPLVPVLVGMEEAGVLLDVPYLEEMSAKLALELGDLEEQIYDLADERFNINSPQQLGTILFEKLGYPVIKRTRKTRTYATDAEVLEELTSRGYPLPSLLLQYRELSKLKSTYVDALPALVGQNGRLHTRFNQAVAATGRLSSTRPNLQNIPVRSEVGQRIRRAFIAGDGKALLVADYSQIELRILAHIAGEEALIDAFAAGEDIHRATAATVFGVAPDLVTAEQRRAAKVINFGILYGMSAFGLSRTLGIEPKEAQLFIGAYLDRYPAVKRYMEETLKKAEAEGKVATLYGRIRWLPELRSRNRNLRENARRMAINARIQGTAADLLKIAMITVDGELRERGLPARLLLTVHDELVLEVEEAQVEGVTSLVRRQMEGVAELRVPLVVEVGWGKSWYGAKS